MKSVALIVTYNRLKKLQLCLQATCSLSFDHIVIVDNASTDDTSKWLLTLNDARLHVLTTKKNSGGAGGFKYGSEYIANHLESEWIFFFDDDAYPDKNLLNNFEQLQTNADHKLFCSKVIDPASIVCPMNVPYKKIPSTLSHTISYVFYPSRFLPKINQPCDVETFSFVGAIIHQDILRKYKAQIYEDLFIYFDDIYFSYFLTQIGYKIRYSPELLFVHDITSSAAIYKSKKLYYFTRNLLASNKIFTINPPFSNSTLVLRILKIILCSCIKGRCRQSLYYLYKGLKDGLSYKVNKDNI